MEIKIYVVGQTLKIATHPHDVIEGSQNFVLFRFFLDASWDGLTPFAQFAQNDTAYNVYLDEDNTAFLPSEITAGEFTIMLYGTDGQVRGTTNILRFTMGKNRLIGDAQSIQITQTLYDQLIERINYLLDTASGDYSNLVTDLINRAIQAGTVEELAISPGSIDRDKVNLAFENTLRKADSAMQPSVYDPQGIRQDVFAYADNKTSQAVDSLVKYITPPDGYTFVLKSTVPTIANIAEADEFAASNKLWLDYSTMTYYYTKSGIYFYKDNINNTTINANHAFDIDSATSAITNPDLVTDYYISEDDGYAYFKYLGDRYIYIESKKYIDNEIKTLNNQLRGEILSARSDARSFTLNRINSDVIFAQPPEGYTFVFKDTPPLNKYANEFYDNNQLWLNIINMKYYSPTGATTMQRDPITGEWTTIRSWDTGTQLISTLNDTANYYVPEGDKYGFFKLVDGLFVQIGNTSYAQEEIDNKITKLRDDLKMDGALYQAQLANIGDRVDDIDEMIQNKQLPTMYQLTYVTPDMFGAVGDGVFDDTEAMIACFNYANANLVPVVWHGKTIYMKTATEEHCPIIDVDCDFSGCTILMDSNNMGQTIFQIGPPPDYITDAMIGKTISAETCSTVFQDYPNSYITVESYHYLGRRFNNPGTETWYRHKQGFVTNSYGAIQPLDLFREISEYKTVRRIDKMARPITCTFGKILIKNATASAVILCHRANVTIQNTVIIPEISQYIDINKTPFTFHHCYNTTIKNITAINLPINSDKTVTSYIIDVHLCYKMIMDNITATKGWGASATHWCTDIIIRNSHLGRADFHYGTYGLNIVENCDFISYPCKIEIGYGDGTVIVRDCFFYKHVEGQIYSNDFIQMRNDFAMMFSGKLIFVNNTVQIYDHLTDNYSWLLTYRTYTFDDLLDWAPRNLPYIYIDRLMIRSEAQLENFDKLQLIGVKNAYVNEGNELSVGQIYINCDSIDLQVKLITDFTGFDTTAASLYLRHCYLDATEFYGKIYKDEESIVSSSTAKIYNTYVDHSEIEIMQGALEVFDDTTEDNMTELTPTETVIGRVMNLKSQQPYPGENDPINPKYAYAVYDILGDYPYLVTGHTTTNAANGNGSLVGYYDNEDNWIASDGFEKYVPYSNYRSVAPPQAVKMIINLGSGANNGKEIKVIKINTKSASGKLNRMQAVIDDVSGLLPHIEPVPDILDIHPATVELTSVTPTQEVTGCIYNLKAKSTWPNIANGEEPNPSCAHNIYAVTPGKIYRVSGRSTSNALNGNGALGAFYNSANELIDEPFGRDKEWPYNDYEVTAPRGAEKMIVNSNKATNHPISVSEVEYIGAYSQTIQNVLDLAIDLPAISNIMDLVKPPDELTTLDPDTNYPVQGKSYNLIQGSTWGDDPKYSYSIYTNITPGKTYFITGSTTSKADETNGNGALCAFYDSDGEMIGAPYGRENGTRYSDEEVEAPEGAAKLIINTARIDVPISVKYIKTFDTYSQTINNIISRLTELEENGGGGTGGAFQIESMSVTPALVEIGSTVTSVTITYTCNKTPASLTLNGNSIEPLLTSQVTLDNLSLTEDTVYSLVAQTAGGLTTTKDATISFVNNIYYGVASAPNTVNEAFVKQELTRVLKGTKNTKFVANASTNQYIWFAAPVEYGDCQFSVGGFSGGFELVNTITGFTNSSGYTENYRVYRSDNPNLGNTTVEVM